MFTSFFLTWQLLQNSATHFQYPRVIQEDKFLYLFLSKLLINSHLVDFTFSRYLYVLPCNSELLSLLERDT